jgi:hypothetical protein
MYIDICIQNLRFFNVVFRVVLKCVFPEMYLYSVYPNLRVSADECRMIVYMWLISTAAQPAL